MANYPPIALERLSGSRSKPLMNMPKRGEFILLWKIIMSKHHVIPGTYTS